MAVFRVGRDEKDKMTAIEYTIYEQPQPPERKRKETKPQTAFEIYREIIKDNIDYDILMQDMKFDGDRLVGNILVMICEVDRTENNVVMDTPLVNMRRQYIFMLSFCYRVGKLPPLGILPGGLFQKELIYGNIIAKHKLKKDL